MLWFSRRSGRRAQQSGAKKTSAATLPCVKVAMILTLTVCFLGCALLLWEARRVTQMTSRMKATDDIQHYQRRIRLLRKLETDESNDTHVCANCTRIPIVQSHKCQFELNTAATNSWRRMRNPMDNETAAVKHEMVRFDYHWYFDEDIDAFLQHYSVSKFKNYPLEGIEKVDFFRYAFVYETGGLWADADTTLQHSIYSWLHRFGLDSHKLTDFSLIVGIEFPYDYFQFTQWLVFAPQKRSAVMRRVLAECSERLAQRDAYAKEYILSEADKGTIWNTGPRMWTYAISAHIADCIDLNDSRNYNVAFADQWQNDTWRMQLASENSPQRWKEENRPSFYLPWQKLNEKGFQIVHLKNDERILVLAYRAFGAWNRHKDVSDVTQPVSQQLLRHAFDGTWKLGEKYQANDAKVCVREPTQH